MHTTWADSKGVQQKQVAPLSLVVSSFAPVEDVRLTLTPDLKPETGSRLVYVDLGKGEAPLGATALAQVYGFLGDTHADADAALLKRFFNAMQKIVKGKLSLFLRIFYRLLLCRKLFDKSSITGSFLCDS